MSGKRRDNKRRILRNGETQRKDGLYSYKYTDAGGQRHEVTSWKLTKTDATPSGKREKPSLRELEEEIQKQLLMGVRPSEITVNQLVEKYLNTKAGVKPNTVDAYNNAKKSIASDAFGERKVKDVKVSDAKAFIIKLQKEDGKGYNSIQTIRSVLKRSFQMALDDELINRNPFLFSLKGMLDNDSETGTALTQEQEESFLEFIKTHPVYSKYYEAVFILFNTGVRISEFCGITVKDIDFENHVLNIDHQLQKKKGGTYRIELTKTESGKRRIPINEETEACFKAIIERRKGAKIEPVIDGYSGFLYFDEKGEPKCRLHWLGYFKYMCKAYNKAHTEQLPDISPHDCRHTFCSLMANNGMNPKALQYVMGHSNISITLRVYTHAGFDEAQKELEKMWKTNAEKQADAVAS